ncbi:Muskelin 1 [Mitosporidium daphniae]
MVTEATYIFSSSLPKTSSPQPPLDILSVSIYDYSGYVKDFHPTNILLNNPQDQASRWSSSAKDLNQFITLRIAPKTQSSLMLPLATVQEITFGKYHLPHVCNLKEFKVFVSVDGREWREALHQGLKNDGISETFPLRYFIDPTTTPSFIYPVQFVKIVPISTWGIGFNFGIWFVQLKGTQERTQISASLERYVKSQYMKGCLATSSAMMLPKRPPGIKVEKDFEEFFHHLYDQIEEMKYGKDLYSLILEIRNTSLLDPLDVDTLDKKIETVCSPEVLKSGQGFRSIFRSEWTQIERKDGDPWPAARGGHQLVYDRVTKNLLLFGGWDGNKEFADFWSFDCSSRRWTMISPDTSVEGGPSPRSVHRCIIDASGRFMYCLGRYFSPDRHSSEASTSCDFYRCDLSSFTWELLSTNTKLAGGPDLIYDHQMVFDERKGILWVFGGRVCSSSTLQPMFSGLFSFSVSTKKWKQHLSDLSEETSMLLSRVSFMMFLGEMRNGADEVHSLLIIINGQRHLEEMHDAVIYDLDEERIVDISNLNFFKKSLKTLDFLTKSPSFSMKGHLFKGGSDGGGGRIVVLAPSKDNSRFSVFLHMFGRETILDPCSETNSNWGSWQQIDEMNIEETSERNDNSAPIMRYAFNLAGDDTQMLWLFGGTIASGAKSEEQGEEIKRVADMWQLTLHPKWPSDFAAEMKVLVRQCMFLEKISSSHLIKSDGEWRIPTESQSEALRYLREQMEPYVSCSSPVVKQILSALPECLFLGPTSSIFAKDSSSLDLEDLSVLNGKYAQDPVQFAKARTIIECRKTLIKELLAYA